MQIQKRYSRAPITEAIIDLRVALADGFTADRLTEIHLHIKDEFPIIQSIYTKMGTFTLDPNGSDTPIQLDTSDQHSGFLLRSRDNLRTFQATTRGFTFNL